MYLSSNYLKNFDKDLYYKILLLESFEDRNWHTAAQLAETAGIDARSIIKYLNELTKNYQRFTQISTPLFEKNGRQGFCLPATLEPIEYERFLIYLVQSTLKYQLLHEIFFEDFRTMYQFAQKHYISESTAHRKINELKLQLKEYGITLRRSSYVAQGEEMTIRMYLHMTFWRLFRGKIWPFPTISQSDVKQIATQVMSFFDVQFNEIKQRRLEYMIGAFLLRKSQKHVVKLRPELLYFLKDNSVFHRFCTFMAPSLPNYFQSETELASLFFVLMTREEYYSYPAIFQEIYAIHEQKNTWAYQALCETEQLIIKAQEERGQVAKPIPTEAKGYLLSGHVFAYLFPHIKETINGNGVHFWNQQQAKNPTLKKWMNDLLLQLWKDTKNPAFENTEFLGERYLTVLKAMPNFAPVLPEITLLLMTDLPLFEEKLLMRDLQQFFKNSYQLHFLPPNSQAEPVDLLISTSKVHGEPWARFDYFVVTQDLQIPDYLELAKKLQMIEQQKERRKRK